MKAIILSVRIRVNKSKSNKEGGITHKWLSRFVGPYEVIDRIGVRTYQIGHCADIRDIRVCSIDDILKLKRYYPRTIEVAPNIPKDQLPISGEDHGFNEIRMMMK